MSILGWVQEMEPPARGGAALVLGEQADVLQEPEGHDRGSLQGARGSQVGSILEMGVLLLEKFRFGVYWSGNEPTIFLRDLELIKRVQVTDAHEYFSDFGKKHHQSGYK